MRVTIYVVKAVQKTTTGDLMAFATLAINLLVFVLMIINALTVFLEGTVPIV